MENTCFFGNSKIFGECEPKKSKYRYECTQHDNEQMYSDDASHKGICLFDDGVCSHVCDILEKKLAQNLRTLLMTKRPANTQRSSIPARDACLSPYVHCNAKYMTEIRNVGIHFRSSSNMMDAFIKLKQRNEKRFNLQRAYYNLIKVYTLNDVVFVLSIVYCLGITSLNSNGAMKIHKITERQIISKPLCIY